MEDVLHFTAVLETSNNKLWGFHLPVPEWVAQSFISQGTRRVICTLNNQAAFQCGLIPKGEGDFCIMVNKKWRTQLGLREGSAVSVQLSKDESEYGLPLPEELQEALDQDEAGRDFFEALPPGKKRTLLYIVGFVKDQEKRIGHPRTPEGQQG